ncbi:MAG: hypothetical protein GY788_22995 [bacterium]|nr:hypothetical protein [bacterium]
MSEHGRALRAILRLLPADYRQSHADEIVTTLRDAQENGPLRARPGDLASLASAALKIRARSHFDADWRPEIERGIVLGVRAFMLFLAVGAAAFLWTTVLRGASIYWGYDYSDGTRILFAAVLLPLIAAFVLQLYGRWREATVLAVGSNLAAIALAVHKITANDFGVGFGTLAAVGMSGLAIAMTMAGDRLSAGAVRRPLLFVGIWAFPSALVGPLVSDLAWQMGRPIVAVGGALVLVAIGMAVAGRPHGLVACAVLILPGWLMGGGLQYAGGWGYVRVEFVLWTLIFMVATAALLIAAMAVVRRTGLPAGD